MWILLSFNPRPAGWPGAARNSRSFGNHNLVSILARLVGRALQSIRLRTINGILFQSSPGWLAGRCFDCSMVNGLSTGFNPRPAGWPGAAGQRLVIAEPTCSFNPRPAGWPGAAGFSLEYALNPTVSILARLVGRALLDTKYIDSFAITFQSSPGWLAGRCQRKTLIPITTASFNPRPAGWPGAAPRISPDNLLC